MRAQRARLPKDERRIWDERQVRDFVAAVRKEVGDAWAWLPRRVHGALIAEYAFSVVRSNHREAVPVAGMDCLLRDMQIIAGLRAEDEA